MDADGQEHPLTESDIEEELNAPDVEYYDDGSVWVYYKNQKIDITDKFDDEKICYLKIEDGKDTLYLTIKYEIIEQRNARTGICRNWRSLIKDLFYSP